MSAFKIGDEVRCLTGKYKMINNGDIDTVHAIEPHDFIRLTNSKRYKYKEKYFIISTKGKLPEEEKIPQPEKEPPMATWKNPFKFTTVKPTAIEIYNKIKSAYSSSLDVFKPDDIHTLLFFHLSTGEWGDRKKVLLTQPETIRALRVVETTVAYKDDKYFLIKEFIDLIENPLDLPKPLYITALAAGLDVNTFETIFGIQVKGTKMEVILTDTNGVLYKITNRYKYLNYYRDYLVIDNSKPKILISHKSDIEKHILGAIIKNNITCAGFTLLKSNKTDKPVESDEEGMPF